MMTNLQHLGFFRKHIYLAHERNDTKATKVSVRATTMSLKGQTPTREKSGEVPQSRRFYQEITEPLPSAH